MQTYPILSYTYDQLISSVIYLGYKRKFCNSSMHFFLQGYREDCAIFNLNITIVNLRKWMHLVSNVSLNYGFLWIVHNYDLDYSINIREILDISVNQKKVKLRECYWRLKYLRVFIWTQKWYFGILLNFKSVYKTWKLDWLNLKYPNSILFMTTINPSVPYKEAVRARIPCSEVLDSDCPLEKTVDTEAGLSIIPANEKTIKSIYFYYKLVLRFILRIRLLKKLYFFQEINKKSYI